MQATGEWTIQTQAHRHVLLDVALLAGRAFPWHRSTPLKATLFHGDLPTAASAGVNTDGNHVPHSHILSFRSQHTEPAALAPRLLQRTSPLEEGQA